jgi:RNA polymerase sigma-70 factor (ECF subfamily)
MTTDREKLEASIREAADADNHDRAATLAIDGYGPEILGFLVARMRDQTAASDIFAIFCEDIWKGLPKFQWRCTARVWAYTLARHAANRFSVQAYRKHDRNVPLSQANILSQLVDQVRSTTMPHLKTAVKSRMRELREQLPKEDQTVLILRVDKKMSWNDLAEVMAFDGEAPDEAALKKEAARLRKRFQLAKEQLRKLAEADGLIGAS